MLPVGNLQPVPLKNRSSCGGEGVTSRWCHETSVLASRLILRGTEKSFATCSF